MKPIPPLKTGALAYVDSFAGPLPCKVLSIKAIGLLGHGPVPSSQHEVRVRLTADRGAYRRGETLTDWAIRVFPRRALRRYGRIRPYTVEADA